jgi:hypothetical protein
MMGKTLAFRSEKAAENAGKYPSFSPRASRDARYPHRAPAHFTSLRKSGSRKSAYTKPQKGLIPLSTASYSSSYFYL